MAKAIHSMIRVLNEEKSVKFYKDAFALTSVERQDFESFTLVYMRNQEIGFELELTINKDRTQTYDLGNGYGHIAFCVDDLDSEHARFIKAGHGPRDILEIKREGVLLARFFFVQDPDGYQIEVLQKHGRYH